MRKWSEFTLEDFDVGLPIGRTKSTRFLMCRERRTRNIYTLKVAKRGTPTFAYDVKWELKISQFSKVLRHPNIITMHGYFEKFDNCYTVYPYMEKGSLAQYLQEKGKLHSMEAAHFTLHLAHALRYCHSQGLIIGTIRPINLYIDSSHSLLISDLGYAITVCQTIPLRDADPLGYLAPECNQDCNSDIWIVGILLYLMLEGAIPFGNMTNKEWRDRANYLRNYGFHHCPPDAVDLICAILVHEPSLRLRLDDIISHDFIVNQTQVMNITSFDAKLPETQFILSQKMKENDGVIQQNKEKYDPYTSSTERLTSVISDIADYFVACRTNVNKVIPISPPSTSHCLFNQLHSNVMLDILKQLPFQDFLNLAFTCKTWYHAASSAPNSIKPSLEFMKIIVDGSGFNIKNGDLPHFHKRINRTPRMCLTNAIHCETIKIIGYPNTSTGNTSNEFLRFLYENISRFRFHKLVFKRPVLCEKDAKMIYSIAEFAKEFHVKVGDYFVQLENKCIFDADILEKQLLSHTRIVCASLQIDTNLLNRVLKQWTEGQRPNLEHLYIRCRETIGINEFNSIIRGLEQLVTDKQIGNYRIPQCPTISAKIVASSFTLKIVTNVATVQVDRI